MRQNRTTLIYMLVITSILLVACTVWTYQRAESEIDAAFSEANQILLAHDHQPLGVIDALIAHKIKGQVWPQWETQDGTPCPTTCHAQRKLTASTKWGIQVSGVLGVIAIMLGMVIFSPNPRRNLINLGRDRIAIDPRGGDAFPVIRTRVPPREWGIMARHKMRGIGRRQYGSAVMLGSPGRGKSNLLKSWLLSSDKTNFIVIDLKGDLYETTAAHRATLGPVICLDLAPQRGHALDPLQHATPNQIGTFAAQLVMGDTAFWSLQTISLIAAYSRAAQYAGLSPIAVLIEAASLPPRDMARYARELLTAVPEEERIAIERDFSQTLERLWDDNGTPNNQDAGVLASFKSVIKPLDTPEISSTLTQDTFNPTDLVRKRSTVYISTPTSEPPYKLPVELLLSYIIRSIFDEADNNGAGENIVLLADEAGVLEIPLFSESIAEGRSRNFSLFAFVQSAGQLSQYTRTNRWQDLQDIITHWIYLGSSIQDDVRRHLSEICGVYDVRVRDVNGELKEVQRNAFEEFASGWKESHALAILDYDRRYVITGKMITPYSSKRLQTLMKQTPPPLPQLQVIKNLSQPPQTKTQDGDEYGEIVNVISIVSDEERAASVWEDLDLDDENF